MWHVLLVQYLLLVVASASRGHPPDVQRRAIEAAQREFFWRSLYNNVPDAQSFLDLVDGLGLFPAGLPPATTLLMPTNKAMQKMLADSGFTSPEQLMEAMPQIEDEVAPKLIAFALHHVIPSGALTGGQLVEKERVATALEGVPALIVDLSTSLDGSGGAYFLSDGAGSRATILGSIEVGGSIGHLIDSVVLPEIGGLLHCPSANLSDAVAAVGKVPPMPASAIAAAKLGSDAGSGTKAGAAAQAAAARGGARAADDDDGDAAAAAGAGSGASAALQRPVVTGLAVHLARERLHKAAAALGRKDGGGAAAASS